MSAHVVELAARRRTTRIFAVTPVNMDDVLYCVRVAAEAPSQNDAIIDHSWSVT